MALAVARRVLAKPQTRVHLCRSLSCFCRRMRCAQLSRRCAGGKGKSSDMMCAAGATPCAWASTAESSSERATPQLCFSLEAAVCSAGPWVLCFVKQLSSKQLLVGEHNAFLHHTALRGVASVSSYCTMNNQGHKPAAAEVQSTPSELKNPSRGFACRVANMSSA